MRRVVTAATMLEMIATIPTSQEATINQAPISLLVSRKKKKAMHAIANCSGREYRQILAGVFMAPNAPVHARGW